jgi:hypothetical protein
MNRIYFFRGKEIVISSSMLSLIKLTSCFLQNLNYVILSSFILIPSNPIFQVLNLIYSFCCISHVKEPSHVRGPGQYSISCKFIKMKVGPIQHRINNVVYIYLISCCSLWSIEHPWNASFHFSFLIFRQSVWLLGRGIDPSQGLYLHTGQHIENKRTHTKAGFEPTITASELAKTVHASHCLATVTGNFIFRSTQLTRT